MSEIRSRVARLCLLKVGANGCCRTQDLSSENLSVCCPWQCFRQFDNTHGELECPFTNILRFRHLFLLPCFLLLLKVFQLIFQQLLSVQFGVDTATFHQLVMCALFGNSPFI